MKAALCLLALWLLGACGPVPESTPPRAAGKASADAERATAQTRPGAGAEWPNTGGDAGKTHHSRLAGIHRGNVGDLGLAWLAELDTDRVLEATPLVVDGVLYTSGVAGRAYAFDAASGAALWQFVPPVDMQVNRSVCCDQGNRGVALARGRIYVSALDGWLYALDAKTGAVVWKTDAIVDRSRGYSSTGAPEIAGDVVVIGNAGAEFDVRGYVSAFGLDTGALAWRFWTVPRDPALGPQDHPDLERAVATWDPDSRWDLGGGGTVWDAIHYDPLTGYVIIGTGNGGPYHSDRRSPEGGDQLYLASLVALDAKTGRVQWHYQQTPHDSWDFTSAQPLILTRLEIDGEDRPVIIHAPKNGFLYVLDRRDGELLRAHPIVRTNWASAVDLDSGRPLMTPESSDYSQGPKIVFPGAPGARNWHPASFDPATGLYYAAVLDIGNLMFMSPGQKPRVPRTMNNDAALILSPDLEAALPSLPPPVRAAVQSLPAFEEVKVDPVTSELRAIDPLTGETRWAVPAAGWQDRGGVLTTDGGLLFQGSIDGSLNVYDQRDGALLKRIDTGTSILAAPMTYEVEGIQYVAVMAAWGGGGFQFVPRYAAAYQRGNQGRLLVFALGGGPVPVPDELPAPEVAPAPPPQLDGVTNDVLARGQGLYMRFCGACHAFQHRSITPDLRRMSPETHAAFQAIVLQGALVPRGMPRWDDVLSAEDARAIHAWLVEMQGLTRADELARREAGIPIDAPSQAIMSAF